MSVTLERCSDADTRGQFPRWTCLDRVRIVRSLHGVQLASSNELGWIVVGRFVGLRYKLCLLYT